MVVRSHCSGWCLEQSLALGGRFIDGLIWFAVVVVEELVEIWP